MKPQHWSLLMYPLCLLTKHSAVKCQSMFVTTGYDGDWPGTEQSSHRDLAETRRPGPEPSSDWGPGVSLRQPEQRWAAWSSLLSLSVSSSHLETVTPHSSRNCQCCTSLGRFDPNMKYLFIDSFLLSLFVFLPMSPLHTAMHWYWDLSQNIIYKDGGCLNSLKRILKQDELF